MELTSPWSEYLSAAEGAALDPGVPEDLPRQPDVLVVGGGILGVATADACAGAGAGSVLLVDKARLGSGATRGAAGLLVPESHAGADPAPLVELGRSSLVRWRQLEDQVPGGVGLTEMDWIALEPLRPGLLDAMRTGAERLDEDQVARLAPGLARPVPGLRIRQARVNPLLALARLATRRRAQVSVATGVEVVSLEVAAGRVQSVATTAGIIAPGAVVLATGESPRLPGLDLDLPTGLVKGHLLLTAPGGGPGPGAGLGTGLPGSLGAIATDIGGGRLLAGGTLDAGDRSPEVRPEVIAAIRAELVSAVPAMAEVPLTHAWCCFRPAHPDRMPVVDQVPGLSNAWVTSGHFRTGILVAPAAGAALAAWIVGGRPPPEVAAFGATRLGRTSGHGSP